MSASQDDPSAYQFVLSTVIETEKPFEGGYSIGFTFCRPDIFALNMPRGTTAPQSPHHTARQALVINKGATMKEVGELLSRMADFFKAPNPDEICWDGNRLFGNELILPEVPLVQHPDLMVCPT